jgi:hypothetical protein
VEEGHGAQHPDGPVRYRSSNSDGTGPCILSLNVVEAMTGRTGNVGGTLAFGGAVILFGNYVSVGSLSPVDLNLTLGIRTDSLLRP